MQKALQAIYEPQAHPGAHDIAGVTGLQIIRAMVAGARTPHTLAAYRDTHCRKSEAEIAAALTGHYQAEHVFALRPALAGYDFPNPSLRCGDRPDLPNGAPAGPRTAPPLVAAAAGARSAPPRTGLRSAQRVVSPGRCRPARCDGPRRRDGAGRADRDWRKPAAGRASSISPRGWACLPRTLRPAARSSARRQSKRQPSGDGLTARGTQPDPQRQRPGRLLSADA